MTVAIDPKGMVREPEQAPSERKAFLIYYAKVNLAEARRRRRDRGFSATLIGWAAKARCEAAGIDTTLVQRVLFR